MRKLLFSILIGILVIILIGCSTEPISDEMLIDTYKQLVVKDFESQKNPEEEEASKLLQDIYVEPALSESRENLQLMGLNDIKREYKQPNWNNVVVIENNGNMAILKVDARIEGDEYTIAEPSKNLGPFAFDYIAEVSLKKVKNKWLISEIKPASAN